MCNFQLFRCQPVTLLGEKEKIGVVSTVRRPNMRRAEDECRREHAATEGILRCSGQRLFHDIQVGVNYSPKMQSTGYSELAVDRII